MNRSCRPIYFDCRRCKASLDMLASRTSSYRIYLLRVLITVLQVSQFLQGASSKLLSAKEHILGQWDVRFARRGRSVRKAPFFDDPSFDYNYTLQLKSNATFILLPAEDSPSPFSSTDQENCYDRKNELDTTDSNVLGNFRPDEPKNHDPVILRGTWSLRPNPYCVTDRFFDELSLVTNAKTRMVRPSGRRIRDKQWKEKVKLELHCKVRGRYSSDSVKQRLGARPGRAMSRLTQGTVMLLREGKGVPMWQQRVVIASFQARTNEEKKTPVESEIARNVAAV